MTQKLIPFQLSSILYLFRHFSRIFIWERKCEVIIMMEIASNFFCYNVKIVAMYVAICIYVAIVPICKLSISCSMECSFIHQYSYY